MIRSLVLLLALASAAQAERARLAVVIDDFGLDHKGTPPDSEWYALPWAFTAAVMPDSPRSRASALAAAAAGKEVILHMPFDPYLALELPPDSASPADRAKVEAFLVKSLAEVPGARGMNNHRSEKATRNRPLMAAFASLLKKRGLLFLDSRVSGGTVAYDELRKAGVPSAINDFFLDQGPRTGEAFCRKWLGVAASVARRRGHAVVIGHHYFRSTLDCLRRRVPELQAEGLELVPISAIARP